MSVYNTALNLYYVLLETYFDKHNDLSYAKKIITDSKYDPSRLTLKKMTVMNGIKKNQMIQQENVMKKD